MSCCLVDLKGCFSKRYTSWKISDPEYRIIKGICSVIGALEMVQIFQLLFTCNHNLLRLNVFESSNVLTVLNPKVIIFFLFKGFFKHILLGFYAFIQEQTVKTTWKMANQLGSKTENRCSLKPAPRPLCRFIFTFFFAFQVSPKQRRRRWLTMAVGRMRTKRRKSRSLKQDL